MGTFELTVEIFMVLIVGIPATLSLIFKWDLFTSKIWVAMAVLGLFVQTTELILEGFSLLDFGILCFYIIILLENIIAHLQGGRK